MAGSVRPANTSPSRPPTWGRSGTDVMWVRGYDGTAWSAWDPFFLNTNGL